MSNHCICGHEESMHYGPQGQCKKVVVRDQRLESHQRCTCKAFRLDRQVRDSEMTAIYTSYSQEVLEIRQRLHDFGGYSKYVNYPGHGITSFKKQAALEMAARLEAEQKIRDLTSILDKVWNVVDCLDLYKSDSEYAMSCLVKLKESMKGG